MMSFLKGCDADVYGIDIDLDSTMYWKHNGIDKHTTIGDAQRLPFRDEAFEMVILHSLKTAAFRQQMKTMNAGSHLSTNLHL